MINKLGKDFFTELNTLDNEHSTKGKVSDYDTYGSNEKTAGGPGSGVKYPNTEEIKFLKSSPIVSIGYRKKFMEDYSPAHKDIKIEYKSLKYKCQEKMVPKKVVRMLMNSKEVLSKPIDVIRDHKGDLHVLDGHHRAIVAILLKKNLRANIYNMPKE